MKIALFSETYLPQINGVATHVKVLKEGLEKLNHQVLIVTADSNTKIHYIENGVLHCPAIKIKKFYNLGLASPISKTRLSFIKEFKPDIIHIHNEFGTGLSGIQIAKHLNIPLVYTMHTIYDDYLYYVSPKAFIKITKKITHKYERFLANKAFSLISPSNKGVQYLKNAGVNRKVHIIPNSVELDVFSDKNISKEKILEIENKYTIPSNSTKLCFAGRLGKEKNVDTLLKYWAKTVKVKDNLHLIIMGDGPELNNLKKLSKSLNISNLVTFTGSIEHHNLAPYYALCNGYITTSLSDTNSISMLEAMSLGLPIFCLKDPLNEGQVQEGINGFIFNNESEMYEKIKIFQKMDSISLSSFVKKIKKSGEKNSSQQLAINIVYIYNEALSASVSSF
ncbi:glycosyltransferase [Clostridium sp.]|uniref:glycosyltransferase n=1 Tax=Clostridium sp. TaxID=1506 RepID=UPI003F301B72